jgi:hypothetical protein
MDYLNMTPRELALTLMYAAEVGNVDPDLAREAATRIDPNIKKESKEVQRERYREMLERGGKKIAAIKAYRAETGAPLRDAKAYIDQIEDELGTGPVRQTPHLGKGPTPKLVNCRDCDAEIRYMPEDIEERHGTDYSGGPDGYKRVKCPRAGCYGYGYIETW